MQNDEQQRRRKERVQHKQEKNYREVKKSGPKRKKEAAHRQVGVSKYSYRRERTTTPLTNLTERSEKKTTK